MNKILTIVIPSYNTESYIDACLPLILDSRVLSDIEVLVVDDGSTDQTGILADKYQVQFPQTVKVIHKENGGHGSGINCGIFNASGKYFKVIDGDDWVDENNLVCLVHSLKEMDSDIDLIINPYWQYNILTKKRILCDCGVKKYHSVLDFDSIANELPILGMHGITIKTDILKNNHILMQEKCYYDDSEYDIYPVPYIHSVICYDTPVYVYRIGNPTQSVNIKNVIKNIDMHKKIILNLIQFYNTLPSELSIEKRNYIRRFVASRINSQYMIYLKAEISKDGKNGIQEFDSYLNSISPELYKEAGALQIKLLRSNTWIMYIAMHLAFKIIRLKRGF